jgi:hypothetical protein
VTLRQVSFESFGIHLWADIISPMLRIHSDFVGMDEVSAVFPVQQKHDSTYHKIKNRNKGNFTSFIAQCVTNKFRSKKNLIYIWLIQNLQKVFL